MLRKLGVYLNSFQNVKLFRGYNNLKLMVGFSNLGFGFLDNFNLSSKLWRKNLRNVLQLSKLNFLHSRLLSPLLPFSHLTTYN